MNFEQAVIDRRPPSQELVFCHTTDLTGNGRPDIYVGEVGLGQHDNLRHFIFENTPRVPRTPGRQRNTDSRSEGG